jgi:DNA transposition AAA+ family ATPase
MRHEMAMTKNVRRFLVAVQELRDRPYGLEGMGLLYGPPGEGKTTTLAYVCNQLHGIYIRANACWTVTAMLGELCHELGLERRARRASMVKDIIKQLSDDPDGPRPILVDEADYLLRQADMLDALRDIYDMVPGAAVVMVGMEEMAVKIQRQSNGRFARRITQWVEFSGIDQGDCRVVADTVCEISIADDLVDHLRTAAHGNIGRMVVGLSKIETFATTNGLRTVGLDDWGDRQLFYDQPTFTRRGRANGR